MFNNSKAIFCCGPLMWMWGNKTQGGNSMDFHCTQGGAKVLSLGTPKSSTSWSTASFLEIQNFVAVYITFNIMIVVWF